LIEQGVEKMNIKIQYNCFNIDWKYVSDTLKKVGMAYFDGEVHKKAFENSHTVVFVFDDEKLIGFGRAISDGAYQAAIYDVAVLPEYQGKKIGKTIINSIIERIPQCSFILYAAPGKENFYRKLNFKKMKTGMALFLNAEKMQEKGFTE
jgi:ribosomal protein S18 acetylase RimI-like enzyme